MKRILFIVFLLLNLTTFSSDIYIKGKILSLLNYEKIDGDDHLTGMKKFEVEILEGPKKGEKVIISHPIHIEKQYNIAIKSNDTVVLYLDIERDEFYIVERDRRTHIFLLLGLFLGLTLLIARKQGAKAILSLGITGFLIFKFMIPRIILGQSPILIAVIILSISSIVTIFFMTGFNPKGVIAILGTLGGVIFAGLLSVAFSNLMGFTGYSTMESINYAHLIQKINLKELISAGVIIGSAGAIMDVSMSISSALSEVISHKPEITPKELYKSGMSIGRDIIGTMINTLILAYIGGALFTIIVLTIQQNDFPNIRVFNFEFVGVEFLRAFCGSIGILIAVPLTSILASYFYFFEYKNSKE